MAKRNIRIENPNDHSVTINLKNFNSRIIDVTPKGFTMLEEDELAYLANTSKVFSKGTLRVVNKEELTVVHESDIVSPNIMSDEDIKGMMKLSQKGLISTLEDIDNVHVLNRILATANELNKSVRFIEIIEKRIEEILM